MSHSKSVMSRSWVCRVSVLNVHDDCQARRWHGKPPSPCVDVALCDAASREATREVMTALGTLLHTATHCYTLQHTAIYFHILQHTATLCNTLWGSGSVRCGQLRGRKRSHDCDRYVATYCNILQHTATYCNTLPRTAKHCAES